MGGIPVYSIRTLWNMANFCIDHDCTPDEYWRQSRRETQAIMVVNKSRVEKARKENR